MCIASIAYIFVPKHIHTSILQREKKACKSMFLRVKTGYDVKKPMSLRLIYVNKNVQKVKQILNNKLVNVTDRQEK